jgi:hypothetical protein
MPLSERSVWPVMNPAAGEARNVPAIPVKSNGPQPNALSLEPFPTPAAS